MTQIENNQFAETIHRNNYGKGNRLSQLVYVDGEFVPLNNNEDIDEGAPDHKGEVITSLTTEGFASDVANVVPNREELYSRTHGIFEVDTLKDCRVLIIGLGSFGSRIAVSLVQEGVGTFALMDFDIVELHNLSRHIATVHDISRLKTDVVEEAILGKNPYAQVDKFTVNCNDDLELLDREVEKADIVICATDNNQSRFNIAKSLAKKGKVGILGRAFTRAEGGDVLRQHPGGPCYCCIFGHGEGFEEEITNVASARRDGIIPAYMSEEDADTKIQVGLSSDIEPICNLMVKLALVELSKGKPCGLSSLDAELGYDYYLWANRREKQFQNWKAFSSGEQPTILRWYGVRIPKDTNCVVCGDSLADNLIID